MTILRRKAKNIRRQDNVHWAKGYKDGESAFRVGKKAIPAQDENAREYSRTFTMSSVDLKAYNDYLSGWNSGWHQASINARVPENGSDSV